MAERKLIGRTVAQWRKMWDREENELIEELEEFRNRRAKSEDLAREWGGICYRQEIAPYLGVSEARVSVLVGRGQFRNDGTKFSRGDVIAYAKNRKPGRPRKKGGNR